MNRIRTGALRHVQNLFDVEVRLRRSGGADWISFIRVANVQGWAIDVGINRDSGNAHFVARADDAHRNLSAIGNQNFLEHATHDCTEPAESCAALFFSTPAFRASITRNTASISNSGSIGCR